MDRASSSNWFAAAIFGPQARVMDGVLARANCLSLMTLWALFKFVMVPIGAQLYTLYSPQHFALVFMLIWGSYMITDTAAEVGGSLFGKQTLRVWGIGDVNRKSIGGTVSGFVACLVFCLWIVVGRGFLEPGARLHEIACYALASKIECAEIELGAAMAGLRRFLEQFDGTPIVARDAGALGKRQRQPVTARDRAAVGGALQPQHAFHGGTSIEQHGAEPCRCVEVSRGDEPAELRLGGRQVAGAIGRHAGPKRLGHVRCIHRLRVRGEGRRGERRREQQRPQRRPQLRPQLRCGRCQRPNGRCDHLVLKTKAWAAAVAFSISSGFRSRAACSSSIVACGTFHRSAIATHL